MDSHFIMADPCSHTHTHTCCPCSYSEEVITLGSSTASTKQIDSGFRIKDIVKAHASYVCNGEKREKVGHEHMRRSIMRSNLTLVLFWRREEGSGVPERLINLRDTAFFSSSSTENMHVFSIYVYFVLISGHSHHWQMGTWHNVSSSHESCSMRGSEEGKQTLRLSDLFKHQLKIL